MKKQLILTLLISFLHTGYTHAAQCKDRAIIERITSGYVAKGYGADDGNAVYVKFKGDEAYYPLSWRYNLNDKAGPSLLSMLNSAMVMRLPVSIWDHAGTPCDDFDEVEVHRD